MWRIIWRNNGVCRMKGRSFKLIRFKMKKRAKYVIEPFMTVKLGLNGNELVLFTILWAESDNGSKVVDGDYTTLSAEMNVTVPTFFACLNKLADKGYVEKTQDKKYRIMAKAA